MEEKLFAIRQMLDEENISGIVVEKQMNFSWLTGGRGFIGTASELACAPLVITKDKAVMLADNIEAARLNEEETDWLFVDYLWHEESRKAEILAKLTNGSYKTDSELASRFYSKRVILDNNEIANYRTAGKICGEILENAMKNLKPGQSELELAGVLSAGMWSRQIEPIVLLIAFDERIFKYRHPLPTANKLKKYAMGVICGRYKGLIVSATRLVHFGLVPDETKKRVRAAAIADAAAINTTRPGNTLGFIFQEICNVYKNEGYPGEEHLHHQGGLTGYAPRENRAMPNTAETVKEYQAYAWNPSVTGAKSEDTILVLPEGNEIISHTGTWEYIDCNGLLRPNVLVL